MQGILTFFLYICKFTIFVERNNIMTLEEFKAYFGGYINNNIVTAKDRFVDNKDFWDCVCFDAYRIYEQSTLDIDTICKLSENILFSVNRYKPYLGQKN